MMPRFDHVLIANRGEIAMRIIRTARALGYRTTAVYSWADADAPHVRSADHAVLVGPANAAQSYLAIDRLIAAAKRTGAGAVHPGYGFLSENAAFAEACAAAGLVFLGPDPIAIKLMGNKAEAKRRAEAAGVPCVRGYQGEQDDDALIAAADAIGYPIMVKAAAGGGGRGMRLATHRDGLGDALRQARSEALAAFGSDEMILERAIMRPRHIEVQVLADEHGTVLQLGERDCSVQRRHQKIIEEAPSPAIADATRAAMADAAVRLAAAISYRGVGTVEFIVDAAGEFFFIEMNTRLQVEHPVTELVTGIDLVAQQLHVAQGLPLALQQDDIVIRGHAIEARLYAEDPAQGFLPSTGPIHAWRRAEGPGVRIDAGIRAGQIVTPHYDPMLAKIIAHGATRHESLIRLDRTLAETILLGPITNATFLRACIASETFTAGRATTAFLGEAFGDSATSPAAPVFVIAAAAALADRAMTAQALAQSLPIAAPLIGWSSTGAQRTMLDLIEGERRHAIEIDRQGATYRVAVEAAPPAAIVFAIDDADGISIDGVRTPYLAHVGIDSVLLHIAGTTYKFSRDNPLVATGQDLAAQTSIRSPMHGAIINVLVREGDVVSPGDRLVVVEAMKMQHELKTAIAATVVRVIARAGDQAAQDALLIELAPREV